ncbi:MAG: hypothetical protein AAF517_14595 [Planctomycetota bacterium]
MRYQDLSTNPSFRVRLLWTSVFILQAGLAFADRCADGTRPEMMFSLDFTPGAVRPGESFTTRFTVDSTIDLQGLRFFIDFDEESLELLGVDHLLTPPEGASFEFATLEQNTQNEQPNTSSDNRSSFRRPGVNAEEGYLRGEFSFGPTLSIPSDTETPLYDFHFRVREGVTSPLLNLHFQEPNADEDYRADNAAMACDRVFHAYALSDGSGGNLGRSGGGIEVIQAGECDRFNPPDLETTWSIDSADVLRGQPFSVSMWVESNDIASGLAFSVDFDESSLTAEEASFVRPSPGAGPWPFERIELNSADENEGSSGIEEGFVTGAVVFSFERGNGLPANTPNEVVTFDFLVSTEAPLGPTVIEFKNGALIDGTENRNYVSLCGQLVPPEAAGSFVLVNARIGIIDEIGIFIRGDSNTDRRVDISDPVATLAFLFSLGEEPRCSDAADANDDGKIDLSDPIFTLSWLFLDGPAHPSPGSLISGPDPTEDSLSCADYPAGT